MIHTVKGCIIVSEADVFLECPCFLHDLKDVSNLFSGSSASLKPNVYIWNLLIHVLLKAGLKDSEHYLASIWNEHNFTIVWTFFVIALLWDWKENWPFPVLWPLLSFPTLLAYWVQHFRGIFISNLSFSEPGKQSENYHLMPNYVQTSDERNCDSSSHRICRGVMRIHLL